ncbi:hypothetical protein ABZW30_42355 [Kitasatospora sp. NPDC004669]|uniref:hypothetical protein n=1 Tax=Kitasatospora sp. NPDC004669 TaxID=3154555 RepID=UPI0033AF9E60
MPKNQTTAAQGARQDARAGAKFTSALRTRQAQAARRSRRMPVLRFLASGGRDLYELVGGIAATWAQQGQRVLLLQEANSRWRTAGLVRRGRRREISVPTPPEPTSAILWQHPTGAGLLAHHTFVWNPGPMTASDRAPLQVAVAQARDDYDVVVLLPDRNWSFPDRDVATMHVAVAQVEDFPHTDCRIALPDTFEERGIPLSPEQSAAVLRERYLSFLFGIPHLPVELSGLILQVREEIPVDDAYLDGVERDMDRAGLRTLGWTTFTGFGTGHRRLPEPSELSCPDFLAPYARIAARLHQRLES